MNRAYWYTDILVGSSYSLEIPTKDFQIYYVYHYHLSIGHKTISWILISCLIELDN